MSQIHYKFRADKDGFKSIEFDGLSISVYDLKQDILRVKRFDPEENDLVVTNADTDEVYKDESALIPKSTSVIVRRVPYSGPKMVRGGMGQPQQQPQQFGQQHGGNRSSGYGGGGGGQGYGGGGSFHRGHHGNTTTSITQSQYGYRGPQGIGLNNSYSSSQNNNNGTGSGADILNDQHELERNPDVISDAEEARIAAMLQQTDEQWSHQQTIMQMQRPVFNSRGGGAYRPRPRIERPEHQGPPPPNYICHRCGIAGHWIHNCPTIGQPSDGNSRNTGHRIKRTTGIPKSFLQKVDRLEEGGNALVTSDGTLVVAQANEAAWNEAQKQSNKLFSTESAVDPSQ
ncbi:Retinoblastoma-binding protein, partial [Linderina macrospora]